MQRRLTFDLLNSRLCHSHFLHGIEIFSNKRGWRVSEWIPYIIGLIPSIIPLKLFLEMVPSSSADVNRVLSGIFLLQNDLKWNREKCKAKSFYKSCQLTRLFLHVCSTKKSTKQRSNIRGKAGYQVEKQLKSSNRRNKSYVGWFTVLLQPLLATNTVYISLRNIF